jgi:hypothetical protein
LNYPILVTLTTIGLASYGEFEFRRKIGKNYQMPNILPKPIYQKHLKLVNSSHKKNDEIEDQNLEIPSPEETKSSENSDSNKLPESYGLSLKLIYFISYPWRLIGSIIATLINSVFNKNALSYMINCSFLLINIIHLLYLGNLFQAPDMPLHETIHQMEKFHFISTKLAIFSFIFGHLC